MTESERFAHPQKKVKIVERSDHLLALVSTSTEELFNRKILLEKYGEAIMVAQHYRRDTGPVYRRQLSKKSDTVQPAVYRDLLPCVGEDGVEKLFRHDPSPRKQARAGTDLNFPLVVVENSGLDKTRPVLYIDCH